LIECPIDSHTDGAPSLTPQQVIAAWERHSQRFTGRHLRGLIFCDGKQFRLMRNLTVLEIQALVSAAGKETITRQALVDAGTLAE
jgi:hypothetical protein